MRRAGLGILVLSSLLLLVSCGGTTSSPMQSAGSTSFNFTMTDTPPAGVDILSFEVTVTGAVLQPNNVSLLSHPVDVEVTQLETESAFLSTLGVPPGTYNSVTVTFSNPQMTIKNGSTSTIASCAPGAVCELTPTLNPASVTVSSAPFPLTLSANTATGLKMDFNLNASVQSDLSVDPTITFTQLPVVKEDGEMEDELDDISGQVTAVDTTNSQFTIQNAESGQPMTFVVNSNTQFDDFENAGLPNAFSSLKASQIVEVDAQLNGSGQMVAKEVHLKAPEQGEELEGTIVSVDSATQFHMVVLGEMPDISGISVGSSVTVTLASGATFQIASDGVSIPSGLSFATSADLMVGQVVSVAPASGSSGPSITTSQVRLETSQVSGQVQSVNGDTFVLGNLPSLFTSAGITSIQVTTSSATEFEDISGASALAAGQNLAVQGFLFNSTTPPTLVATKVRLVDTTM